MTNSTGCSELADYEWLTGPEAALEAEQISGSTEPVHRVVERLRRQLPPNRVHLVVELVELRRRASEKFAHAGQMFFTRLGLEQATDEQVAAYKATRFAGRRIVADLCCGIGGDLLALSAGRKALAVDRDPTALHLAAANVRAVCGTEAMARVDFRCADVDEFDLREVAAWHIDPDRRPAGHRTSSPEWSSPGLASIEKMLAIAPNAAIKLSPAAKAPADWAKRGELEWISRAGECRQLVAWHGELALRFDSHTATIVLRANFGPGELNWRTISGAPKQPVPIASAPDQFVFDVDAAVLAAHLKGVLAAQHGLQSLSTGPTYLTGPVAIINDPALSCFGVTDVLPLRTPLLTKYFRERNIGRLEIKKRGVDIDPEKLRRDLKLRGELAATLLITPVAGRAAAIVGQRA